MVIWGWLTASFIAGIFIGYFGSRYLTYLKNKNK